MKQLKWALIGLGGLVLGVLVGGYVLLSTFDVNAYREEIQAEVKKATGRELRLSGPVDLRASLTPAITLEDVGFGNAAWGSRGELATIERFEVEVALMPLLTGNVQVKRLILVEPDILIETNAEGASNLSFGTGEAAAEETASEGPGLDIGVDRIAVERGRLTYKDGRTGEETVVALHSLEAQAAGLADPIRLALTGSHNDLAFEVDGAFGSFDQLNDGPFPLDVTAKAAGATVTAKGAIAEPKAGRGLDLAITARGEQIADLGALAGAALPALGAYDVAAEVRQEGTAYTLSAIAATLGASDIAGEASLDLAGGKPAITGKLASEKLDLAALSAAGGGAGAGGGGGGDGRYVFTEDPLPLDGLKAADAAVKLTAAQVVLPNGMPLSDLLIDLTLRDGALRIDPLGAVLSGGRIGATVSLDGSRQVPGLAAVLNVDALDYGQLLKLMGQDPAVSGTMDVALDVKGAGASMRAIAAGLNGKAEVSSDGGVISNRLLKIVAVGLGDVLGPLMGNDKDARLNCMLIGFDIENGLATSKAMVVDSEAFTVAGGGTVDLKTERLNLTFDTETRETSIASLAVPFNVTGTMKSPSVAPDPLGTALGVAKTAGMVINPVAGLGVLIGEQMAGSDERKGAGACAAALVEAPKRQGGAGAVEGAAQGAAGAVEGAVEGVADDAGKAVEGAVEGIKSLFGD